LILGGEINDGLRLALPVLLLRPFVGVIGFCLFVLMKAFLIAALSSVPLSACAAPRREPPRLVFDIRSVDQSRRQRVHGSCDVEAYAAVARTKIGIIATERYRDLSIACAQSHGADFLGMTDTIERIRPGTVEIAPRYWN
jgi:hypothetical protein